MVKMVNIEKRNGIISCDIYPEDSTMAGSIMVDLKTQKVVSYTLPDGYEDCSMHVRMAKNKLLKLSNEIKIPENYLSVWY